MNVKKLFAVILAVVMLVGVLPVVYAAAGDGANPEDGDVSVDIGDVEQIPEETEPTGILGDLTNDGLIDTLDLLAMQAHLSGKATAENVAMADIDGNSAVDTLDLLALQAHLSGKNPIA
ncbi:MAG: dockerin type I repeat-containing protein [Oscillospiraceae bacterium]|nr:dockerin type I repeat-containing protein [Oscillospiraceae bacterium]